MQRKNNAREFSKQHHMQSENYRSSSNRIASKFYEKINAFRRESLSYTRLPERLPFDEHIVHTHTLAQQSRDLGITKDPLPKGEESTEEVKETTIPPPPPPPPSSSPLPKREEKEEEEPKKKTKPEDHSPEQLEAAKQTQYTAEWTMVMLKRYKTVSELLSAGLLQLTGATVENILQLNPGTEFGESSAACDIFLDKQVNQLMRKWGTFAGNPFSAFPSNVATPEWMRAYSGKCMQTVTSSKVVTTMALTLVSRFFGNNYWNLLECALIDRLNEVTRDLIKNSGDVSGKMVFRRIIPDSFSPFKIEENVKSALKFRTLSEGKEEDSSSGQLSRKTAFLSAHYLLAYEFAREMLDSHEELERDLLKVRSTLTEIERNQMLKCKIKVAKQTNGRTNNNEDDPKKNSIESFEVTLGNFSDLSRNSRRRLLKRANKARYNTIVFPWTSMKDGAEDKTSEGEKKDITNQKKEENNEYQLEKTKEVFGKWNNILIRNAPYVVSMTSEDIDSKERNKKCQEGFSNSLLRKDGTMDPNMISVLLDRRNRVSVNLDSSSSVASSLLMDGFKLAVERYQERTAIVLENYVFAASFFDFEKPKDFSFYQSLRSQLRRRSPYSSLSKESGENKFFLGGSCSLALFSSMRKEMKKWKPLNVNSWFEEKLENLKISLSTIDSDNDNDDKEKDVTKEERESLEPPLPEVPLVSADALETFFGKTVSVVTSKPFDLNKEMDNLRRMCGINDEFLELKRQLSSTTTKERKEEEKEKEEQQIQVPDLEDRKGWENFFSSSLQHPFLYVLMITAAHNLTLKNEFVKSSYFKNVMVEGRHLNAAHLFVRGTSKHNVFHLIDEKRTLDFIEDLEKRFLESCEESLILLNNSCFNASYLAKQQMSWIRDRCWDISAMLQLLKTKPQLISSTETPSKVLTGILVKDLVIPEDSYVVENENNVVSLMENRWIDFNRTEGTSNSTSELWVSQLIWSLGSKAEFERVNFEMGMVFGL